MKGIIPNVWRTSLNEDDWNFLQIQNDEWPRCLAYELFRENVQAEVGGSFPSGIIYLPISEELRQARFSSKQGEDIRAMLERLERKPAGTLSKSDWSSYLSRRKKEHWKLIPKSQRETWHWIALDWHTLYQHRGDEVEYAGTHLPFPPIMEGDGETEIVPFRIPWGWRDDEIKVAFAQWLKENRRENTPEPAPPAKLTGAGSYLRQVKKNLKALAAWRLIQHHKGNHIEAYGHPGAAKYLGKAYAHASEWTDAKKTVQAALKQIHRIQWEVENFASTKVK